MPAPLAHVASSQPLTSSRRLLTPSTNPIPLLSTPTALYTSLVHSIIIPLYYYARSPALIKTPLDTLIQDLLPVAIIQALSCATCIPAAGSWDSGTKDGGKIIEGTASVVKSGGKSSMRKKGSKAAASMGGSDGGILSRIMVSTFSSSRATTSWGTTILTCEGHSLRCSPSF
jgi:hypothetical protein